MYFDWKWELWNLLRNIRKESAGDISLPNMSLQFYQKNMQELKEEIDDLDLINIKTFCFSNFTLKNVKARIKSI